MNSRPLLLLLPLACLSASAAQAQTPPTLTYALTGAGTTTLIGQPADYRNYTFNITGFSNVGADPNNAYTIFSFGNSSVEKSANFYALAAYNLPAGWTFDDSHDFVISTDGKGIHATDPTFGLILFQKAGTPAIDFNGAAFTLYHQVDGVDPFADPIYASNSVPEASSLVSFGLLLLSGGLVWTARRRKGSAAA